MMEYIISVQIYIYSKHIFKTNFEICERINLLFYIHLH